MEKRRRGFAAKEVRLSGRERKSLLKITRHYGRPYREVLRARIVLTLAQDPCVSATARQLHVDVKTVRRWRDRYLRERSVEVLNDAARPGRPPHIGLVSRCELLKMACGRPSDFGAVSRDVWTLDSLVERFVKHHPRTVISRTSVLRILNDAEVRPHRVRMWLHSPDPQFKEKVTDICGLYLKRPANAVVLCIDEKSGIQVLGRKQPLRIANQVGPGRLDFEYARHGTRTLFAALNVHSGEVFASVRRRRKALDLLAFMERIARHYPRKRIHVVWDNLNIHYDGKDERWRRFNQRHGNRFRFHYTPVHASWVNQVEIFFSIMQKRILRFGVFHSAKELEKALLRFVRHWNRQEAHPFRWTFKGYPLQSRPNAA